MLDSAILSGFGRPHETPPIQRQSQNKASSATFRLLATLRKIATFSTGRFLLSQSVEHALFPADERFLPEAEDVAGLANVPVMILVTFIAAITARLKSFRWTFGTAES